MSTAVARVLAAMVLGIAASGCSSGPAGSGMAQSPSAMGGGRMMQGGDMMMAMSPIVGCPGHDQSADARLSGLHVALRITSAQEPLWTPYANAYRRHAASMGMPGGQTAPANATVTERVRRHEMMMSSHLASLVSLRTSLEPLYQSFSAAQKATAEALACGRPMS